jgi:hypothetical protein
MSISPKNDTPQTTRQTMTKIPRPPLQPVNSTHLLPLRIMGPINTLKSYETSQLRCNALCLFDG